MDTLTITLVYKAWATELSNTICVKSTADAVTYAIEEVESRGYTDIRLEGIGPLDQLRHLYKNA